MSIYQVNNEVLNGATVMLVTVKYALLEKLGDQTAEIKRSCKANI